MVCGAIPVAEVVNTIVDRLCRFGVAHKEPGATQGKPNMLELTMYGLVGLTVMLVVAFFCAFGDEFSPVREKSAVDLISNAQLHGSQMIELRPGSPRVQRIVRRTHETAPAPMLQNTSAPETGLGAI
jgi:hypothetical protein